MVWPHAAKFFGTHGAVKVTGRIEGEPFTSSFMAMGDGVQMLPVKASLRKAINKKVGDTVAVELDERVQ